MVQTSGYRVAVVGATGAVGREMVEILESRNFPVSDLRLYASEHSAGETLSFKGKDLRVEVLRPGVLQDLDFALFSAGEAVSREYAPEAARRGVVVIDNSAAFRMEPEVPLVVPEVNAHALEGHRGIIANPNCSTIQLVMVLKPLQDQAGLRRVVITTFQSVSGKGKEAMEELEEQTRAPLSFQEVKPEVFPCQIAFNCLPHIDRFVEEGYTREEMKMVYETRKILELPDLPVTATAVRVPVFVGHAESVNVELEAPLLPNEARAVLSAMPGVVVLDDPSRNLYPTPLDVTGRDEVYVGRIRRDPSVPHGLNLWIVADNLRKGAALNAVQIAECLIGKGPKMS